MPEHPEIRAFVNFINAVVAQTEFTNVAIGRISGVKPELPSRFKLTAQQRGKQIKFNIIPTENSHNNHQITNNAIVVGLGLTGYFKVQSSPVDAIFSFLSPNFCLSVLSETPDSFYFHSGDFDKSRSPDPLFEPEQFLKNLLNLKSSIQPLCTALLDQRFFNGVGNYLRCELLWRLDLHPFTPTNKVDLENLAEELQSLLEEAFEVVGDTCEFQEFLKCYGKATNRVKVAGRTLWTWKPVVGERVRDAIVETRIDRVRDFMVALAM